MWFEAIEIIALILIVLVIVKLFIFLVHPNLWYETLERAFKNTHLSSFIAFIFAMLTLYFLISSGLTIKEILSVSLFIVLLIAVAFASYSEEIIPWMKTQDIIAIFKKLWLYTFVWLLLLAWGLVDILIA